MTHMYYEAMTQTVDVEWVGVTPMSHVYMLQVGHAYYNR